MRVYLQRNDTPLKFHKFVWFVWVPLSFFVALFNGYEVIRDFLEILEASKNTAIILTSIIGCVIEAAFILAPVFVFIGFFEWKRYAWFILMFLSVSNIFISPFLVVVNLISASLGEITGKFFGIAFDVLVVLYYWKRRKLFGPLPMEPTNKNDSTHCQRGTVAEIYFCHQCGKKIPKDSEFCCFCGEKM